MPTELGLAAGTSSTSAAVREETFSDISLAPSAMPSPFPGSSHSSNTGDGAMQMQMNPLEDLDAFGQGGGISQGHHGGQTAGGGGGFSGGSGGGGNTATEMLINQASSITANFQQALPAVASTVFSHFSNYLKGGQQPHSSHDHNQPQQMHPVGGIDGGVNQPPQYVSPLDDIYHQQMSNPTESVNQMPLFISPQDAPGPAKSPAQGPPMTTTTGAGNTYRIGGQRKKTYAPPPVQGFTSQAPVNFTPGYDPTMPIQSGTATPLPPMVGESVQATVSSPPPPPRPSSSVPQQTMESVPNINPPPSLTSAAAPPNLQPTTVMPSTASMFMPPPPPVMAEPIQPPQPQSFFQTPPPPPPSQLSQQPVEAEKSKSFISSFFNPNSILDRLQGKSPQPTYDNVQQQPGAGVGGGGYENFGGIATGQTFSQPPMAFPPNQMFNPNPIQAPPSVVAEGSAIPGAMGLFNPPPPQSAMSSSSVTPISSVFNQQQPPTSTTPAAVAPPMMMMTSLPSAAATPELPPPMQEPPRAAGSGGGYRMNKSSRLAYANPNLIAQSSTTSGFMAAATNPGQVPPPTQWFNPGGNVNVASVPDVAQTGTAIPWAAGGGGAIPQQLATIPQKESVVNPSPPQTTNFFAPPDVATQQVQQQMPTIPNIPTLPPAVQEQPPPPMIFNPIVVTAQQEEVKVSNSTPDLVVQPSVITPSPSSSSVMEGVNQEMVQSFFNPVGTKEDVVEFTQSVGQINLMTPPTTIFTPDLIVPPSTTPAIPPIVPNVVTPVPSSAFFDNAFSQNNNATVPVTSQSSGGEQQQTATAFQPVNFFNAFNNPTPQPPSIINEPAAFPPLPNAAMAFEPTQTTITPGQGMTTTMDNNANVAASELSNSLWSDKNANFTAAATPSEGGVGGEISAILPTDSSFLDEASTRAVRDEQSQQDATEDFLSSFERGGEDINSKFFDSPPEVQPTDPIANPNFFKSFMKAKFSANKFGEDLNDQSVVVEPPSHADDSSVSCASFPSFDQSSAQLGNVTEAGFQVSGGEGRGGECLVVCLVNE